MSRIKMGMLAALWIGAAGCGGAASSGPDAVVIAVTPGSGGNLAPYDTRGARLRAAQGQLVELLGHPVRFEIDAALSDSLRSGFEQQLIGALEELVRSLRLLQKDDADQFARIAPRLERIACVYKVTAEYPEARFDPEARLLTVSQGAHPSALLPRGLVSEALTDAESDRQVDRYETMTAASVPAEERRAYFRYLVATRPGYGLLVVYRRRQQDGDKDMANSAQAGVIARVVALHESLGKNDGDLGAEITRWLVTEGLTAANNWYRISARRALEQVPAKAPFRDAERAYGHWLTRQFANLDDAQQNRVIFKLFDGVDDTAFPTVDRLAIGWTVIDRWRKDGKPQGNGGERTEIYEQVLCPRLNFDTRNGARCPSASRGWLGFASSTPARTAALAKAVDQRGDADLAETLVWALHTTWRSTDEDRGAQFLDGLQRGGKPHRAAFDRLIASGQSHFERIASRVWRDEPARRGDLLLFFAREHAHMSRHYGDNHWRSFPQAYGGPIDRAMYERFLGHGAPAFAALPQLWPALGPGYSRIAPLQLDPLLPDASQPESVAARRTLSAIVDRLCEDKNNTDLATLHGALEQRARSKPAERANLSTLLRDTAPGGCKARTREPEPEQ